MKKHAVQLFIDVRTERMAFENLIVSLNARQDCFEFDMARVRGEGLQLARAKLRDSDALIRALASRHRSRSGAIPVLVTSRMFPHFRYGIRIGGEGMILSTASLGRRCRFERLKRYVCHYLADLLAASFAEVLVHDPPIGCIGDAHTSTKKLGASLARMTICPGCRGEIGKAISDGQMHHRQLRAIEQILDLGAGRKRCFVLMPFAKRLDPVMKDVFARLGGKDGWIVERADQKVEHHDAMNNVLNGIRQADLIIADLTNSNPNVYYEVGFAHALGNKRVVLVTQNVRKTPFDLRAKSMHAYRPTRHGFAKLRRLLITKYRDA